MSRQTTYLPNVEAYDKWSATYDTDGNILQAIDTHALQTSLFPKLLKNLAANFAQAGQSPAAGSSSDASPSNADSSTLSITDLGCGTGRAVITLLESLSTNTPSSSDGSIACQAAAARLLQSMGADAQIHITGLDASPGMLAVAQKRVAPHRDLSFGGPTLHPVSVEFRQWDANSPEADLPAPAQAVLSTLVVEHLELSVFFAQLNKCLVNGGLAVVTNMHPDMGSVPVTSPSPEFTTIPGAQNLNTQEETLAKGQEQRQQHAAAVASATGAGFLDPVTGVKVKVATSYVHTIRDVIVAARYGGFEVIDGRNGPEERRVQEWMLEPTKDSNGDETASLLSERGRKWVGINVWFGMLLRKTGRGQRDQKNVEDLHSRIRALKT